MPRQWGPWTEIKLEAIENYIAAFAKAAKVAPRTMYLDLFAGRPENEAQGDDSRVFAGSSLRAAHITPHFSKILVSEISPRAAAEQQVALKAVAGDRAEVLQGDCNLVMPAALDRLDPGFRHAPTFALIDQYSAEVKWSTLRHLAGYKSAERTKVELMMYFGGSFMVRGLHGPDYTINVDYAARLDELYGNQRWRYALAAQEDGELTAAQVQHELVNLMRWQLEKELGYATTLPLKVRNTRGSGIFSMIFATDHPVGAKIMRHLFLGAEGAFDLMVKQRKIDVRVAKELASGAEALFDVSADQWKVELLSAPRAPIDAPQAPYVHDRIWDLDLG